MADGLPAGLAALCRRAATRRELPSADLGRLTAGAATT